MAARAMILAAGLGTRLRPLTEELPKPLVPVANRPLIEYSLRLLGLHGIAQVAINLHHLGDRIQTALGDGASLGLEISYSPEDPILGTGGGIARLRSFLADGTFVLMNGDMLSAVDLGAALRFHRAQKAAATLVVCPFPPGGGYTLLERDEGGWITRFRQVTRPAQGRVRPVLFAGIHLLEPVVFDFLPPGGYSCIAEHGYCRMIEQGLPVAGFVDEGPWLDIGTPELYLGANLALLSGQIQIPHLDLSSAVQNHGVLLGRGGSLDPAAILGPNVVIGDGCAVGPGAEITNSVLWPGVQIAAGSRLDHAVVTPSHRLEGLRAEN